MKKHTHHWVVGAWSGRLICLSRDGDPGCGEYLDDLPQDERRRETERLALR